MTIALFGLPCPRKLLTRLLLANTAVADFDASVGVTSAAGLASQWDSQIGAVSLLQANGAAQPYYIPYSGTNYTWHSGINSTVNQSSRASNAGSRITTGNIGFAMRIKVPSWGATGNMYMVQKADSAATQNWLIYKSTNAKRFYFAFSLDGSANTVVFPGANLTANDNDIIWVGSFANNATGKAYFYYAPDQASVPTGAQWINYGVHGAAGESYTPWAPMFNDDSIIRIAKGAPGGTSFIGNIYRVLCYTGTSTDNTPNAGTTAFCDYNPALGTDGAATLADGVDGVTYAVPTAVGTTGAYLVGPNGSHLLGDGAAQFMQSAATTLNQPVRHFIVASQVTSVNGTKAIDGLAGNISVRQVIPNTLQVFDGTSFTASNADLAINTWGRIKAVMDGANTSLTINDNAAKTGSLLTTNPGGWTLFANYLGTGAFGNFRIKRWITLTGPADAVKDAQIMSLLKSIYGTP